jgi:hypothetical protein
MTGFVNFAELKQRTSIEDVLQALGLLSQLKGNGQQLRGKCPLHRSGGNREFVVTPAKNVWYCFGECQAGGDQLELYAKVKGIGVKEAAKELAGRMFTPPPAPEPEDEEEDGAADDGLSPLPYLDPHHPMLASLDITPATARAFQAGYAKKGIMRGRLAIPFHDGTGKLLAYVGVKKDEPDLYPKGFKPAEHIFNAHRIYAAERLHVTYRPIGVLKVFQQGMTNAIALCTPYTRVELNRLAQFMFRKHIDEVVFF